MNCVPGFNQPSSNSNIHHKFTIDNIEVPESCLLPRLFCMLGLLSVSMNHGSPRPVAEQGSHEVFVVRDYNFGQSAVGSRTELSNRNIV